MFCDQELVYKTNIINLISCNCIMAGLFFNWTNESDNYAEYDIIGDTIEVYLKELTNFGNNLKCFGTIRDNLVMALVTAVIDHEYFHAAISECVDTFGDQEHVIMEFISDWIDQTVP